MAKVWSFAALKKNNNNEEMKIGKIKMKTSLILFMNIDVMIYIECLPNQQINHFKIKNLNNRKYI